MNKLWIGFSTIFLVLTSFGALQAEQVQEDQLLQMRRQRVKAGKVLADAIEQAIKVKEPLWKLKETLSLSNGIEHNWLAGNQQITVYITACSSPEQAKQEMQISLTGISAVEYFEKPTDLGDEAFISSTRRGTRTSMIFRKNNVLIDIQTTSLPLAKKMARYIADHLTLRAATSTQTQE